MSETLPSSEAILLLEDGSVFRGKPIGTVGTTVGEICFNTSMTGYQEVFTDPSYFGQLLIETNVHVGNYGAAEIDQESQSVKINGLICRNFSERFSRTLADSSLQAYLEENKLVGIDGVDTRAIVRHIRDKGAMNAIISSETSDLDALGKKLAQAPSMEGLELSSRVSRSSIEEIGSPEATFKIAVMDYGVKNNILRNFQNRDCLLRIYPARTSFEEVSKWNPDGYFLSNGPGDPASMDYAVHFASKVLDADRPLFGICLGHQVIALALGLKTYKMHHGHRGSNHAVKNLLTGKCEITAQNHGFGVNAESIRSNPDITVTHVNLNDETIEGFQVKNKPAFSVQYHPEASPGPHDSRYLFDQFIQLITKNKS